VREQQYVGIDLHRRRSVIVRMDDAGEVFGVSRIENDPLQLAMAIAEAGPDPEVALEACYGWYWAADLLEAEGAKVHLVHPLGLHWETRRVKNDVKDATELANRLRRQDLPESWIAPPAVRELRELVRYRAKLGVLRTSAKAQVHAVMAKLGILPPQGRMFGPTGQVLLDEMDFPGPYGLRVESLRDLLELFERELAVVERAIHRELKDHGGYRAIQQIKGVGPTFAAIFVAEIGDVHRFPTARHLCSWAGMTPKLQESDTKTYRGRITKMACGAVDPPGAASPWGGDCDSSWWARSSSGPAHIRLRRFGYWGSAHRSDRSGQSCGVAEVVGAIRPTGGRRVRTGGLHGLALRGRGNGRRRGHSSCGRTGRDGRAAGKEEQSQDGQG
jgi:transposase